MSHNLEYLLTRPGALKIATIIFGLVSAILSGHSYGESPYSNYYAEELRLRNNTKRLPGTELEVYNMSSTFICLGISFIYLAAHSLFYVICESRLNKFVDTAFHMCGALFLFAGGTTLIYTAVHIENKGCPDYELAATGPVPKYISPYVTFFSLFHKNVRAVISSSLRNYNLQNDPKFCHYFGEKIVAGAFNIFNAFIYGLLGFVIFTTEIEEL